MFEDKIANINSERRQRTNIDEYGQRWQRIGEQPATLREELRARRMEISESGKNAVTSNVDDTQ